MKNSIDNILNINDLRIKYSMAIDYISDYLINNFKIYDICDFQGDKCISNRLNKSSRSCDGCCYKFRTGVCKYLKNKKCSIDCISCKLFMCNYLEKKYGRIKLQKILPVKKIFNRRQLEIIRTSFFKDKDEIIELLINNK